MIRGKPFNPATGTSRRPTPERFAHLRKWPAAVEQIIEITSAAALADINKQLEQVSKFYVGSILKRVISHLTGSYGGGFVSLECTADGELKVQLVAGTAEIGKIAAGVAEIGSVKDAGTTRTILREDINFSTAIHSIVVAAVAGKKICIVNIALTVGGETDLTFETNETGMTGVMAFGGTDEPRGMVHHFGNFPLCTVVGEAFKILSGTAVQVSGYVTYYTE